MADKTAPESQLRLEWVYGYRGHQCRNNLFYNASGEVVYFVAGVGVVYNVAQGKQRYFLGHTDDIISLALHPDKGLVATAQTGKAPFICVWDSVSMETVSILQGGHERGIAAVGFSGNGNLLASIGLDNYHTLNVWDWRKGKVMASTRGHSDRIFDVQFNPHTSGSLVTCGVKHIKFWTLCGNTLTGKKGIFGKKGELQSILCAVFSSADVAFTGTLSGDIYKWTGHTLTSVIKGAHAGAIYSMHSSSAGFASGSRDGTVRLWDCDFHPIATLNLAATTTGYKGLVVRSVCWGGDKVLAGTKDSEVFEVSVQDKEKPKPIVQGHTEGELWALAVHPTQPLIATGSDDKTIRIWSMTDRCTVSRCATPHPVRSVAFSPDGNHLAAGLQDGSFLVLDASSLSQVAHIRKRKEVLHEMKYSPDGRFLAVGSNDNFVDVYSVAEGYKHVGCCSGSSSFITHLDWTVDSKYIQTNSGASERLYFQMPSGKHITGREEIQAMQWVSWTSVLGPEVNGIWPKYSQVNDVNATDALFEHQVIATGDDFGLVKLFRFPCVKKGAKFKKYVGHSAHVTNVRFTSDHRHLISVGGADHAIFQWRFLPPKGEEEEEEEEEDQEVESSVVGADSDSEESDSDMSDVASLDSELEREKEKNYDRTVYREDLQKLKDKLKEREKETEKETGPSKGRSIQSSSAAAARQGRKTGPPEDSLRLEFVHGYRGYDCRSNLYYTKDGRIVYHIAALGIVYNRETHTQQFYSSHTDDILCLALHPSQDYVATGQIGRDPAIHVWDAGNMATLSVLQGEHSRGVCAVGFSADGKKLASVGLDNDHCIVVWDWRKGEKLATTRGHKDKIFLITWNPQSTDDLVTVGVKHIKFWTQAGGGFTSKRGIFGKVGKPVTMLSLAYAADGGQCYSGGADGKVYHWKRNTLTATVEAHKGPVFAIQRVEKGYVSGGKDGAVCLWNETFHSCLKTYHLQSAALEGGATLTSDLPAVRALCLGQGKILVGTKNSEILEIEKNGPMTLLIQGHMEGEAWGMATHPTQPLCVTASDDGTVRFWDLQTHRQTAALTLPGRKARAVGYSHDGTAVAVGFMDGGFIVVSSETLEQLASFHHRTQEISDIKFSPNGKYLAVGSHDNFVDIYNVLSKKRVGICKGASSYITHVDWDERGKLLQLNTGDREVLYYEAPRGKQQLISRDDTEDLEWSTWTCVLGESCTGIWPAYTDVTDVNAACRSHDEKVIATGDDFGMVKLFQYPSYGKHAKCKQYVGHSAHVTNVRFSHDDKKLVSLGGADMSVMVWAHSAGSREPAPETDQSGATAVTSLGYASEESDTDSEEEGGYDSDVEREKKMDYLSKIYAAPPVHDAGSGTKPHLQEEKAAPDQEKKQKVSRSVTAASKVVTREDKVEVKDLSLDFVFGYRGFDTRHNLLYTMDGLVLYPAAGAGVVYNPLTRKQTFYLEHNDDIICVALNRNPKVVATGQLGKTAAIHVWDYHTKQTLSILQGAHGVGVSSVDFSSNGKLLLSVGLDNKHTIAVWRWTDGTKVAQAAGDQRRVFLAQFRPDSSTQFVSCGVKHVRFWNLAGTQLLSQRGSLPKSVGAQMQTMLSLAFAQDNITFTGSINGDVYAWKGPVLSHIVSRAHTGPVFAMFTCLEDGLIVTAGKETEGKKGGEGGEGGEGEGGEGWGELKLWSTDMSQSRTISLGQPGPVVVRSICRSKGKILVGTQNNEILEVEEKTGQVQTLVQGHGEGELWGLAAHPAALSFVTASEDRTVRIWDITSKALICQKQLDHAARSADLSPDGSQAAVGLSNGEFIIFSASDLTVVGRKRDRSKTIQAIRFSPNGSSVAVGSDDACVDIYSLTPSLSRRSYCRGIPSYVTQLDWSQDSKHLQVSTGVYERLVFEVDTGKQITAPTTISKIVWASWTSGLGEEVIGIWPKNADKADVNTAHLNNSGTAIATGDDFGCLKLFTQFPITEKFAPHKKYFGHSAHVTNVKFTYDDQYVLSAGGDDSCIFVWKCLH